jgi:hypothetical protein
MWASPRRTPDFYPDAVVLHPSVGVEDVLARIDPSAGASVKDSFAALDFGSAGFRRLFDAQWMWRRPDRPAPSGSPGWAWREVTDRSELAAWERGWRGDEPGPAVLPEQLLRRSQVRVVGAYDGPHVVAGMVLHRTATVVGLSNVFGPLDRREATWAECVREAARAAEGLPVVGYEQDVDLCVALGLGFQAVGPLTVWAKDEGPHDGT